LFYHGKTSDSLYAIYHIIEKNYIVQAEALENMGVNIDKNEFYEIIMSNSAHPENIKSKD